MCTVQDGVRSDIYFYRTDGPSNLQSVYERSSVLSNVLHASRAYFPKYLFATELDRRMKLSETGRSAAREYTLKNTEQLRRLCHDFDFFLPRLILAVENLRSC